MNSSIIFAFILLILSWGFYYTLGFEFVVTFLLILMTGFLFIIANLLEKK